MYGYMNVWIYEPMNEKANFKLQIWFISLDWIGLDWIGIQSWEIVKKAQINENENENEKEKENEKGNAEKIQECPTY